MKQKLSERDATLYYEQIDYEAYQDVAWSIPKGIFDESENPLDTAKREFRGINVKTT